MFLSLAEIPSQTVRAVALAVTVLAAAWWGFRHPRVRPVLKAFVLDEGDPLNLAVFRVVLFFWIAATINAERIVWYSSVSRDLLVPPWGTAWMVRWLPVNPAWAATACAILKAVACCAALGFGTRAAAWTTVLLGAYALAIPQLFGKVNHYHHLLWFAAILAASPCADVLSVDAWLSARRRGARAAVPAPHRAYALPIRLIWLLIGIIYFFPGVWKWCSWGPAWAFSDNLKYWMYQKWAEGDGWLPAWRIDQHPAIYHWGGLATMFFEMGFVWCLFFPALRRLAVACGLAFHMMMAMVMRVWFWDIVVCYAAFIDWAGWGRRLGLWRPGVAGPSRAARLRLAPAVTVGLLLILGNGYCGVKKLLNAWPLSCYPTFSESPPRNVWKVQTVVVDAAGQERALDDRALVAQAGVVRWKHMYYGILWTPDEALRRQRLRALWRVWSQQDPALREAKSIRFYKLTRSNAPEAWNDPWQHELLWDMTP